MKKTTEKDCLPSRRIPVDFVGRNWKNNDEKEIAILYGFNPWKREVASCYLKQYKTAFARGKSGLFKIHKYFISTLKSINSITHVSWGNNTSNILKILCKLGAIKLIYIEDGFLRSIGLGVLHSRPLSWCIDRKGPYFDGKRSTEIEDLFNSYNFDDNSEIIIRAKMGIELFKAARLTKYYNTQPYNENVQFKKTDNYSILVIGQVEDDASIKHGKCIITKNLELVKQARKDWPDADIYFRPHPDTWVGNRKDETKANQFDGLCAIVPPETSIYELFEVVDHVYTMTSLVGLEALLSNKKVTTFGLPFYAGWGLTEDRVASSRRKRTLTIEQLFAVAYILYPKYLHQHSDEVASFEETACFFITEILKDDDIFNLDKKSKLFQNVIQFTKCLYAPLDLLVYLNKTKEVALARKDDFESLIKNRLNLRDYPKLAFYFTRHPTMIY